MNEILYSLYDRRSVRAFEDQPVAEEQKRMVLDAAAQAPSPKKSRTRAGVRSSASSRAVPRKNQSSGGADIRAFILSGYTPGAP